MIKIDVIIIVWFLLFVIFNSIYKYIGSNIIMLDKVYITNVCISINISKVYRGKGMLSSINDEVSKNIFSVNKKIKSWRK